MNRTRKQVDGMLKFTCQNSGFRGCAFKSKSEQRLCTCSLGHCIPLLWELKYRSVYMSNLEKAPIFKGLLD